MESQAAKGAWSSKRQYGGYSQDDWKAWKRGWPNRRIGDSSPDSDEHQPKRGDGKSKPKRGDFHQGYRKITTRDGVIQD